MVNIKRWSVHLFMPPWRWRRCFSKSTLAAIEKAVAESERLHRGELRFVIENAMPVARVWCGMSAYQRAIELFAVLRVWDTEENSGVLIYLCLADREVHIVADRGINQFVNQAEWEAIAKAMQQAFRQGAFSRGALLGIALITAVLVRHFPGNSNNRNELADVPVIL